MRTFREEAVVIKRRDFGEADKFLTVFTRHSGKMQVKAMGIRKLISRRSPHVELLNHSLLSLYSGASVPILTEAQTINAFPGVKEDLTKVGFAYHICELIDGLCPEGQEQLAVFPLLIDTLGKLEAAASEDIAPLIHEFEISLLTMLGYWRQDRTYGTNTEDYIEHILERKLKSRSIFSRIDKTGK